MLIFGLFYAFTFDLGLNRIQCMPVPNEFLRKDRIKCILKITNIKTDQIYLLKSLDAIKSYKDERFKLDLGLHESKELQKAYTDLGLELFTIEIDAEARKDDDLDELLDKRKAYYQEKGNRLYN